MGNSAQKNVVFYYIRFVHESKQTIYLLKSGKTMKIEALLNKKGAESMGKAKDTALPTTVGRELMNNLVERLNNRGNTMIEMDGHFIRKVRINLASNFFNPKEKNICIWAKPFIRGNYLMLNWNGVVLRASDIFGDGINRVRL